MQGVLMEELLILLKGREGKGRNVCFGYMPANG